MINGASILEVADLHAWYGESHVLHGMQFAVHRGELVTLLGRNGAGRTTTLRAILGLTGKRSGSILVRGRQAITMATHSIARLGIGYCPEERGIFASLSTEENLRLPPRIGPGGMSVEEIYGMFPNLHERRKSPGSRLSGGEQQMLALEPELMLLDEPTQGMAHEDVGRVVGLIRKVASGRTILMVEHNLSVVEDLCDTITVLQRGAVLAEGTYQEVSANPQVLEAYVGVADE